MDSRAFEVWKQIAISLGVFSLPNVMVDKFSVNQACVSLRDFHTHQQKKPKLDLYDTTEMRFKFINP